MKIDYSADGYTFLRGIAPYSAGVIALPGFEIDHGRFRLRACPYRKPNMADGQLRIG
jgi:hypothetical protein